MWRCSPDSSAIITYLLLPFVYVFLWKLELERLKLWHETYMRNTRRA